MKNYIRTQISLPIQLKQHIDLYARRRGLSLSEYLRRAAQAYQNNLTQESNLRSKIAAELKGIAKTNSGWASPKEIRHWIRRERKRADDRTIRH